MNRILIEPSEQGVDGSVSLRDRRAAHIRSVLRAVPGDTLRLGVINGPLGTGTVKAVSAHAVELVCAFDEALPPEPPPLDLLLAPPRPKAMKRLWPVLASFGVRRIGLIMAERVEKAYFDTHVLEPAFVRARLLEGCEQSGWTRLPIVSVHRRFRPFVEDELESWSSGTTRLAAHPGVPDRLGGLVRRGKGVLLAVGPEGGWNDFELDLLTARGFRKAGLAGGALRSDVACVALLAVAREAMTK